MVFRQHRTDFICEAFDVRMIMHPPRMTIPLLQVLLGFSIAVQRPLCTVQGGEVRMEITPEERCDRGTPGPATVRMTAVICWYVDGMIAKDRMEIGGFIPVFLEWVPTDGTDRCVRVQQDRLLF